MTQRVQLTRDIIAPACGDHPDLLVAEKGTKGELLPGDTIWPAYVMVETTRRVIEKVGVRLDEFRRVEA